MKPTVIQAILKNATVLASKLNVGRVRHAQKYLQDNGINASFVQTAKLLQAFNIPLTTEHDITEAFGNIVGGER